ncbi:MAG TPA: hypothetical protein VGR70_08820 [Stellaceae bacterium]|nr:hypothetical protein [Stellaceae bacterium]
MAIWFVVGLLGLVEIFVLARIRVALADGEVPLNPAGWLGYSEYLDVTVERRNSPTTYWFILSLTVALAVLLGMFIYLVAIRAAS